MCDDFRTYFGHISGCPRKRIRIINQSLTYQLAIIRFQGRSHVCLMIVISKGQGRRSLSSFMQASSRRGSKLLEYFFLSAIINK